MPIRFPTFSPDELVAMTIAISFAAGLNVYATVATLGLLSRAGLLVLPASLGPLANWWVIAASVALFVVELVADKIPVFDLIWNALQTFVRVPAGALLAFAATTHLSPGAQVAATIGGGLIALIAHGGKTATRAAVSLSPEPFSNFVLSSAEDVLAVAVTWVATRHPFVAATFVLGCLVIAVVLFRWILRALRSLFGGSRPIAGTPDAAG
ncbi:MAG TPA: DUF4126 domain-containing protein [Vicinamibacterales bacterium]|nr:DUF4126 domain-containing protein [Vicinamibacterales bacterium]